MTNHMINGNKKSKLDEIIIKIFSKNPAFGIISALVLLPAAVLLTIGIVCGLVLLPLSLVF